MTPPLRVNDQPRAPAHYARESGIGEPFHHGTGSTLPQFINKTQGRTGTQWDSRYKSSLIDANNYLLSCQRYIEMNPVRAGMVDDPAHYRWSSYRANALGQADALVTHHPIYSALGGD